MASRKIFLSTNEIYHIFNRSIGKVNIFKDRENLNKFLEIVNFYRYPQRIKLSRYNQISEPEKNQYMAGILKNPPLVDIYVNSFMPNHFHFLLKQLQDKGITKFISNIQDSFAKYYNLKYDRQGSLFQKSFKAKMVMNNDEFIHISRYIHINHVTAGIIEFEELLSYEWTSLPFYLNSKKPNEFINTKPILDYFKTPEKYLKFLKNNVNYQRKLKKIKDLMLD